MAVIVPRERAHTANDRARQLASENPGAYYVSYEAMFYGHTDAPAVHLVKVVTV